MPGHFTEILRSPSISMQPYVELIDYNGNLIADVTNHLETSGSYISRDSVGLIAAGGSLNFDNIDDFNFNKHLLVIGITIIDRVTDSKFSWRMGTWIMSQPADRLDNSQTHNIEITDVLSLLSIGLENSFNIAANVNIGTAINNLLLIHGLFGLSSAIPAISFQSSNAFSWPFTDKETYLEISNKILDISSHVGLYTNRLGTVVTHPWQDIFTINIKWNFDSTQDDSYIAGDTELEPDTNRIPNIWIGICNDPKSDIAGDIVKVINSNPDSPHSVVNRSIRDPKVEFFKVRTIEELTLATNRMAQNDILQTRQVKIICGPLPHLWASPVVNVNFPEYGIINRRGVVREWRLPLDIAEQDCEYVVDIG